MSMYFRQQWRDPRLAFSEVRSKKRIEIRLKDGDWNTIWVPDTYFRNEKGAAKFHDVTVSNRMLNVNCSGHVWYVTRCVPTGLPLCALLKLSMLYGEALGTIGSLA